MKVTVLLNNIIQKEGLGYGWGMAAYVEGYEKIILFDTGDNGKILLANMKKLQKNPESVSIVVISHEHYDHIGGLWDFLEINPHVEVFVPQSFSEGNVKKIEKYGAKVIRVSGPRKILTGVFSTGELGESIKEQSLVLEIPKGVVVLTGCSHPGIVNILKHVKETFKRPIYFVTGGFHLLHSSEAEVLQIADTLENLGIVYLGASHCTGELAIQIFKERWGNRFIPSGAGAVIEF
jgi:7,8-dihydropterin-6-yl-methyl-4-(beta-D-ribofuranosyl)aminobenzene 5'-phosphate synthase